MQKMFKHKKLMLVAIPLLLAGIFLLSGSVANATAGGKLSISNSDAFSGSTLSIRAYNLDASTSYAIYKGSTALLNWTTSSSETERIIYTTGDSNVIFYLYSGATTVDSYQFTTISQNDFLPIQMLITLGVSVLVIVIIAKVIRNIRG